MSTLGLFGPSVVQRPFSLVARLGALAVIFFFATPRILFPKGSKMHSNHQNAYIKRIPRDQWASPGLDGHFKLLHMKIG